MVVLFTAPSVGIDGVKEEGKEAILAGTQANVGALLWLKVRGLCEVEKGGEWLFYCGR